MTLFQPASVSELEVGTVVREGEHYAVVTYITDEGESFTDHPRGGRWCVGFTPDDQQDRYFTDNARFDAWQPAHSYPDTPDGLRAHDALVPNLKAVCAVGDALNDTLIRDDVLVASHVRAAAERVQQAVIYTVEALIGVARRADEAGS